MFLIRSFNYSAKSLVSYKIALKLLLLSSAYRSASDSGPCRRGAARGPGADNLGGCHSALLQSMGQDSNVGTVSTEVPAEPPPVLPARPT